MIPKLLHLCFGFAPDFGGKPWSLVHYACLRSALERIRPDRALLYHEFEPAGPWWDLTRPLLDIVNVSAPRSAFGNPLVHPAHRADVFRLETLLRHGGIYLDCDVFVHRAFDDLLHHATVLGREGCRGLGLSNAVILAQPEAPFLRRWLDEYTTFRSSGHDRHWAEHSVARPLTLSQACPSEVTILPPTAFFWPGWRDSDLSLLYGPGDLPLDPGAYANHLWETTAWTRFLAGLTPGHVRKADSPFHRWVRPMVEHLPDDFGQASPARRLATTARRALHRLILPLR
jgi:hypothetical protein